MPFGTYCPFLAFDMVERCDAPSSYSNFVTIGGAGHTERLADHTGGKNLGQPDSTGQLSSLIPETSLALPPPDLLSPVAICFFLILEAALFGFPIPYSPTHHD